MLEGYRVVDFTDERGLLCGSILADLGADVVHVEPPGGSAARRCGPFARTQADDEANPERSLTWWAHTRNQRSIVLDARAEDDREQLLALVARADFLIESAAPGVMASWGLGYEDLREAHPELIYVSISPFGQTGPKAGLRASDLTLAAESGLLFMTGDEDRPPVRVSGGQQAHLFAGAEAAIGALVASQYRLRTGRGQHVDVSAQQALNAATQSDALSALVGDKSTTRSAGGMNYGGVKLRNLYPAKDGFVCIALFFGSTIGPGTARLMDVVHEAGFCDAATRDKDWIGYGELLVNGDEPEAEFERVKDVVEAFTRSKTKEELLTLAIDRKLLLAPVSTIADLVQSPQLEARDYFRTHEHPGIGPVASYPGPFARFSRSPMRYTRRAPLVDEHRDEILRELTEAPRAATTTPTSADPSTQPLDGVKVLDLMWAVSGPTATRTLADYGASVVRIESTRSVDASRTLRPFRNGKAGSDASALFHTLNVGKTMMTLDLASEVGREVFFDLVRWADVVCESFSPQVMGKLGLTYETLREVDPGLIMLSTSLMGQSGPLGTFAGYGNMASAWCGFHEVTGWPDREPAGPWGAYTDHVAARYNTIAILGALEHRAQTGEGQYIDLAQAEASLHFLGPLFLDHSVNGRVATRVGNADERRVPHGVYRVQGDDAWIAIAVDDDEQWASLCGVLGISNAANWGTSSRRLANADSIDEAVSKATASWAGEALESRLQQAGVTASRVLNGEDVAADPQLAARAHFIERDHPEGGTTWIEGERFRLSASPATPGGEVPSLGRDNDAVLREVLGYDDERIAEVVIAGALD